jgi:FKBP-type peptidyl-prolyl cis-trans isomerase
VTRSPCGLHRGRPHGEILHTSVKLPVNRLILGWAEALQLMVVGETTRLWIPQALTYQGEPGRPNGALAFDLELVAIDPP